MPANQPSPAVRGPSQSPLALATPPVLSASECSCERSPPSHARHRQCHRLPKFRHDHTDLGTPVDDFNIERHRARFDGRVRVQDRDEKICHRAVRETPPNPGRAQSSVRAILAINLRPPACITPRASTPRQRATTAARSARVGGTTRASRSFTASLPCSCSRSRAEPGSSEIASAPFPTPSDRLKAHSCRPRSVSISAPRTPPAEPPIPAPTPPPPNSAASKNQKPKQRHQRKSPMLHRNAPTIPAQKRPATNSPAPSRQSPAPFHF